LAKKDGSAIGVDATVDGNPVSRVVCTTQSDSENGYFVVYTSDVLPDGDHTVAITTCTGARRDGKQAAKFGLDYFEQGIVTGYVMSGISNTKGQQIVLDELWEGFDCISTHDASKYSPASLSQVAATIGDSYTAYPSKLEVEESELVAEALCYALHGDNLSTCLTLGEDGVTVKGYIASDGESKRRHRRVQA
jgi:hypothetical protein